MKLKFNKIWLILLFFLFFVGLFIADGCSQKKFVSEKSGAQLWGENCIRCHNAPSPSAFSDYQWETIAMHMRVRANLTDDETNKVVEFLKMAN